MMGIAAKLFNFFSFLWSETHDTINGLICITMFVKCVILYGLFEKRGKHVFLRLCILCCEV